MKGKIHSFQSLGTVDGPGVRSVVFMQGCPLRCPFCHNPDTWDTTAGTEYESSEIAEKVLRYKGYFGKDGGVTVSGGEPLLQAEFVRELFEKIKKSGVSTALDTSGCMINDSVRSLLDATDIVLLDIKYSTDEKYEKYIGISLKKPLDFLKLCEEKRVRVIIRQVITGGINDEDEDVVALNKIISGFSCVEKVELLPFRKFCLEKYESLGIPFPFSDCGEPSEKTISALNKFIK